MIVSIVGAASSYVPILIDRILKTNDCLDISYINFFDIDIMGLNTITCFCEKLIDLYGGKFEIKKCYKLSEALCDSDFVITIFRFGGLELRQQDENLCQKHKIIGQETQGAAGILNCYRQLQILEKLCSAIKEYCPNAKLIHTSNPVQAITKASYTFGVTAVGLCELPWSTHASICNTLNENKENCEISWQGLNHLAVTNSIKIGTCEKIEDLSESEFENIITHAKPANIPMKLDRVNKCSGQRIIPSSYLVYYLKRKKILKFQIENKKNRANETIRIRNMVFDCYKNYEFKLWESLVAERGGYVLGDALVGLLSCLQSEDPKYFPGLNILNDGAINYLPSDSVVEVSCCISKSCIRPQIKPFIDSYLLRNFLLKMNKIDDLVIKSYTENNFNILEDALYMNPLVGDMDISRRIVSEALLLRKQ